MRHRVSIPPPSGPPLRGHLPFTDAPTAPDPVEVTSRWLTRGGRPWFPVSGSSTTPGTRPGSGRRNC